MIDKKRKVFKVNTKHYYHEAKIKLAKRIVDQHWQEWEHKVKDMELQTYKVNRTVDLMKYINFYAARTLFDTPNIDRLIDFYMDNKLSNHRKSNMQKFVAKQRFMEKVYETVKNYYIGHGDWSKSDTPQARYQRGPGYDKFFMRKHCTLKHIKEFRTSKMCHKCAWDPKTEKMNEPLLGKQNVKFHGQLEQYPFDSVLKSMEPPFKHF